MATPELLYAPYSSLLESHPNHFIDDNGNHAWHGPVSFHTGVSLGYPPQPLEAKEGEVLTCKYRVWTPGVAAWTVTSI